MILVIADLHLDAWLRDGRDPLASIAPVLSHLDALIIAGDLSDNPAFQWPRCLARIGRLIDPFRVWIVPGNHDYWSWQIDGDDRLAEIAERAGAHLAQQRIIDIGTVRLLCATLWTDFQLTDDAPEAMRRARMVMPDYVRIRKSANLAQGPIRPEDTAALHRDHLDWLTRAMAEPSAGQRIIVTHHAPSPAVAGPINGLSPAFASNLDAWLKQHRPNGWLFGHTHRLLDATVHGVPVINTSLGYPDEVEPGQEAERLLRGLIGRDGMRLEN
ncbi:metallophosphoesterase [Paracoccus benzoatiresistens]|uniref:Metallophosphoesterase n=1 Tax=Paracoccus benzoatiresistens TaxID=2997341 RepID=A0ABT4J5N6_9RHOB|nr:metallophosphoesterase [Paracoccus sp. EF6]MCZ0962398.1 metallophosphoesterase [Paracoccus sp. EF6]